MQGDAFPTPPIYAHHFQPRLIKSHSEQYEEESFYLNHLLSKIETLMTECSFEESKSFWAAADRMKIKHQVIESMQKIESLFLDLATNSIDAPELIEELSQSLLYTNEKSNRHRKLDMPRFPRLTDIK
ncbi:hypothetical protein [Pseudanabaena mucicola]|uniref:Uncharacterized protein n=1 Tax=Pseudanabaena mucicola FACHB-723 TaxID=2692860 RepID=A0ABR7ZXS8_9CYAN|nr:hypothetical protein [Pseudanabaena mucicola]MBD2188778.1 hypothetical protein [Pseudanabaena mucicola FACHB-723]